MTTSLPVNIADFASVLEDVVAAASSVGAADDDAKTGVQLYTLPPQPPPLTSNRSHQG
jgi:hypothetical protein